jgi:hypothetical protein
MEKIILAGEAIGHPQRETFDSRLSLIGLSKYI